MGNNGTKGLLSVRDRSANEIIKDEVFLLPRLH